ncbi:MAG: HAD-IA family hydrolase [Verrucomicrobiales bacterium]|nr:HAD-IA family hydrolase [Verrucomicrobiales bacterium]
MKGLIFDFDGLMVDTETAVFEGWKWVYGEHGEELVLSEFVRCVGSTVAHYDPAAELERRVGRAIDWEVMHAEKQRRIVAQVEGRDALPGVRELLSDARDEGVVCAVGSSATGDWVRGWLGKLALEEFFHTVRCRTDGDGYRPKPAPDLFHAAAEGLGLEAEDVLVLEDSENGLRAAQAAGMRCVVVPNEITGGSDFEGAWKRLETLAGVGLEMLKS